MGVYCTLWVTHYHWPHWSTLITLVTRKAYMIFRSCFSKNWHLHQYQILFLNQFSTWTQSIQEKRFYVANSIVHSILISLHHINPSKFGIYSTKSKRSIYFSLKISSVWSSFQCKSLSTVLQFTLFWFIFLLFSCACVDHLWPEVEL